MSAITQLIGAAQEWRAKFRPEHHRHTGDEIETGQQFNLMSGQLQASYAGLEQKVADHRELATSTPLRLW